MDYEALGIYTEAVEQFEYYENKRQEAIEKVSRIFKNIVEYDVKNVDLKETLKETKLFKYDKQVRFWQKRANSVCERCERDKIELSPCY
ncbi:MAG: hypothetical protein J6M14_01575 [Campylobacter sp.]|nr:hypothetical protein [Campylobacter sp.]